MSEVLGIELVEIEDWNCCGAIDAVYSYKPLYSAALAARNLALAEKMETDVTVLCSACYYTLSRVNMLLQEDATAKSKVDKALNSAGLTYNGTVKIRHFLEVLLSDVGLDTIRRAVKRPLTSFNVASYYGCLLVRPPKIAAFDDPDHPTRLDDLVEALGASKVEYYSKTRCCGASLGVTNEDVMLELSKNILLDAKNAGANCITTACPLCHFNLDAKQVDIEAKFNVNINLPVFHFTQLAGLAFGLSPEVLGLKKNCVSPQEITSLMIDAVM